MADGDLKGEVVQVPVHVPSNVRGNSVSIVGLANPSFGNISVNEDEASVPAESTLNTSTTPSPANVEAAPLNGNVVQVPVHVPVNVSKNSVSVVGLLNPSFGNTSVNE